MSDARLRVPVYSDSASTLCFVAHRVLARLDDDLAALGVELVWRPLDLALLLGWRRGGAVPGARRRNAMRVAAEPGVPVAVAARWPAGGIQDEATMRTWLSRFAARQRSGERGARGPVGEAR